MIIKTLTGLASPPGRRARLSVFMFHRVLDRADVMLPGEPDRHSFAALISWIAGQYQVLDPLEACDRLQSEALPARAAIITFDDGYADNYLNALPVLTAAKVKACFFIATGFTSRGAMFNDRVISAISGAKAQSLDLPWLAGGPLLLTDVEQKKASIDRVLLAIKSLPLAERDEHVQVLVTEAGADTPKSMMMDEDQLRALVGAGMTVGGHTRHHPILTSLSPADAVREIGQGRQDLADIVGTESALFAYPNGRPGSDFDRSHMAMVENAGYRFAFSTQKGVADRRSNPFALPRFTPWDKQRSRFLLRSLHNTFQGDPGLPI